MQLTKLVNEFEKISLSGQDIMNILNGLPVKVIDYNELNNYNNLDEVFGENEAIILYLSRNVDSAHWVSLIKINDRIDYFDSYGYTIHKTLSIALMDTNILPELLQQKINEGYTINQNNKRIQKMTKDVNTCGAHAIVRCLFRNLTNEEYIDMITHYKKIEPDELVILLISSYLMKLI